MALAGLVPSADELAAITTLETARAFGNVAENVWTAFMAVLGDPADIEELVFIKAEDWDRAAQAVRLPGVGDALGPPITAVQAGRLQKARTAMRMKFGLRPDGALEASAPLAPGLGSPAPASVVGSPISGSAGIREVKLSSLVDVTLEGKVEPLDQKVITEMFAKYVVKYGGEPHTDYEPSYDQISAVKMFLRDGVRPYVDFALFGPHDHRAQKKLMYAAYTLNPETGAYIRQSLDGPGSFDIWWKCWMVYKTTLLLLEAVMPHPLEAYAEFIRKKVVQYGPDCWFIIYQAENRMRCEGFERLRRSAEIKHAELPGPDQAAFIYQPNLPWNGVFKLAVRNDSEAKDFWDSELDQKCLLYLTKATSLGRIMHDGTTVRVPDQPQGKDQGKDQRGPRVRTPWRKRRRGQSGQGGGQGKQPNHSPQGQSFNGGWGTQVANPGVQAPQIPASWNWAQQYVGKGTKPGGKADAGGRGGKSGRGGKGGKGGKNNKGGGAK